MRTLTLTVLLCISSIAFAQEIVVAPIAFKPPVVVGAETFAFVGAKTDSLNINGHDPFTTSYTVSANTSGYLQVWCGISEVDTMISVSYNGVAMTKKASWKKNMFVYDLVAPAAGTHNVVVTYSDGTDYWGKWLSVTVIEFSGVNQTTPIGTFASVLDGNTGNHDNNNFTLSVSSATGEIVVGVAQSGSNIETSDTFIGRIRTAAMNEASATSMRAAGAASVTLHGYISADWEYYDFYGVSVKPAP